MPGCPNGGTRQAGGLTPAMQGRTRGTETSKYPQEKRTNVIPRVVVSESGVAQTVPVTAGAGLKDGAIVPILLGERSGKDGRSA